MNTPTLQEQAQARINRVPELAEHEATIMYDWPECDEHWLWVTLAPAEEIIEWAQSVGDPVADAEETEWRKANGLYPYDGTEA